MVAAHQLRMDVQGAPMAAVTSGLSGDIGLGVFIPEGTRISLRAAPQADAVFLNWSGDTTAMHDTLTLRMLRPFSLTANFIPVQPVRISDAAGALFGTAALETQEGLYLDAAGNRNGVYDLGDFLAAVERSSRLPLVAANPRGEK
jgi:hypothetical protein